MHLCMNGKDKLIQVPGALKYVYALGKEAL